MIEDIDNITDPQNPTYQNLEIFRNRLLNILDRTLEKIRIVCCMDMIMSEKGKLIAPFFSPEEMETILSKYKVILSGSSTTAATSKSKTIKSRTKPMKPLVAAEKSESFYSSLIVTLHHNHQVIELSEKLIDKKNAVNTEFLQLVQAGRDFMAKSIYTTATEERAFEKLVGTAYLNNEKYSKRIAELSKIYETKMVELMNKLAEKQNLVDEQKEHKINLERNCKEELHKIVKESETVMARQALTSDEKLEGLSQEAKIVTQQYHNLLESHLAQEKVLRVKRYKVETMLANWLTKYDQEIGELQAEYETLLEGYEKEKNVFDELQEKFDAQEIIYTELMEEKQVEEDRIFNKKRYEFMMNRSARKIQRWWRAIRARRRSRRRGKKGKKAKK